MLTVDQFISRYPSFVRVESATIGLKLAEAEVQVHAGTWGDQVDEGIGLLVAHKLSIDPTGQNARLESDMAETTYGRRYMEIREQVTFGLGRVI